MLTVMLVEDHPMNRKLFRDILEIQFAVREAGSAEEALALLESVRPASRKTRFSWPRVVLTICPRASWRRARKLFRSFLIS